MEDGVWHALSSIQPRSLTGRWARADQMFGERYSAEQYNDKLIDNLTREIDALGGA